MLREVLNGENDINFRVKLPIINYSYMETLIFLLREIFH